MSKQIDKFVDDIEYIHHLPKWISTLNRKMEKDYRLPFLLIYNAVGIASNDYSKSPAIAIATKNLQNKGDLLPSTNALTAHGEIKQLATLKRLGEKRAKSYLTRFNRLK